MTSNEVGLALAVCFVALVIVLVALAIVGRQIPMPEDPEGDKEAGGW